MGRTEPSAKIRLVQTAQSLFKRQGYDGTGLTQILTESGAPKGSFYHHFPGGKEALAEAVIAGAGEEVRAFAAACFAETDGFEEGAVRLVNAVADWFEASGYAEGCPITSILLAAVPGSPMLLQSSRDGLESWISTAETAAQRDGIDDPRDAALALVGGLEGAWVLARALRSRAPFDAVVSQIGRLR